MNWPMFVFVATGVLAVAEPDSIKEDRDRIQGTWALASTERDGKAVSSESLKAKDVRMIFDGDQVFAKMGDKSAPLGTFTLHPSRSPKAYDRIYPDGSLRRGIYRLEGNTLTICVADLGKDRPSAFATKSGDGLTLVVYQRE